MTDPTPAEIIAFLNGEAPLDGLWFHDPYPATHDRRGPFWWRKYLPLLSPPDAGEVRAYREGVEDALVTVPDGWSWSLGQMMGLPENMRYRCFLSDHNTPDGKATQHVHSDKPTLLEAIRDAVSQAAAIRRVA